SRMSEFPSRRTDHSPLEIRAPGTEFLDAETGGQKSTQETANVWGDRKTGTTPANTPAETAYLESVWKPVVRSDWMVVCAVRYEPVSDCNSLIMAVLQGIFREIRAFAQNRS